MFEYPTMCVLLLLLPESDSFATLVNETCAGSVTPRDYQQAIALHCVVQGGFPFPARPSASAPVLQDPTASRVVVAARRAPQVAFVPLVRFIQFCRQRVSTPSQEQPVRSTVVLGLPAPLVRQVLRPLVTRA
jgi:hypothetical protein